MILLHGIASRHDLPLPFELVVLGGGFTLIITFWIALFAWRKPRYTHQKGTPLPRLTKFLDSKVSTWGLGLFTAGLWSLVAAALVGGVDRIDNPIFGFIFVLLWVGLVPAALLFGPLYRATNPLRWLLGQRWKPDNDSLAVASNVLPAALALAAFLYFELVQPAATTLLVMRIFVGCWLTWCVLGALRNKRWLAQADPFEAYATTVSQMSPWARDAKGTVLWTNPLRNLASWQAPRHTATLACVLLGGTLFDAASNTAWWVRATQDLGSTAVLVKILGLVGAIGVVYLLFWLGARSYRDLSLDELAPGLIPLVVGYCLGHYATMLYLEGQRAIFRLSDPLSRGWNLFGLAEIGPDTTLLAFPMLIALFQVVAIVTGHVCGVLVTHDIALRTPKATLQTHLPLLTIMVLFTMGGLFLMFGA